MTTLAQEFVRPRPLRIRRWGAIAAFVAAALALGGVTSASAAPDQWLASTGRLVLADGMGRENVRGWGGAQIGGSYTTTNADAFSVREGTGRVLVDRGHTREALLGATEVRDAELLVDLAADRVADKGNGLTAGVVLRAGAGARYEARAHFGRDGEVSSSVVRTGRGGTQTVIGRYAATAVTVEPYEWIRMRVQIEGTDEVVVRTKVWPAGSSEPREWSLVATDRSSDRLRTEGGLGLSAYVSQSSDSNVLRVDNFVAAETLGAKGLVPPEREPAPVPPPPAPTEPVDLPETVAPQPSNGPGASSVGSAIYPVPGGALFVSTSGSDAAAGTQAAPFRSVQRAVDQARAGQTIVVRQGNYHEEVEIPHGKGVTIQAHPGEAVWFDGTKPVTSWRRQGNTWMSSGWTATFPNGASFTPGRHEEWFLKPGHRMAAHPDQLFIDGEALRQVRSAGEVVEGTFAVDYASNTLIVGSNPEGRSVRASALSQAFRVSAHDVTLQGFGVRGYANPIATLGAVLLAGERASMRNVAVLDNASVGISVVRAGATLERVTSSGNGMLGVHANEADRLVLRNSLIAENNTERFAIHPVSGGVKVTRTRDVTIADNQVTGNIDSTGVWMDESVYDMTIVNNEATGNGGHGIEVEISDTGIVANNDAGGNGSSGIFVYSSGNLKIFNNYLGENGYIGLRMMQDNRRQADPSFAGHDPRRPIPDPTMPWIIRNVTVANNVFGSSGILQFYAKDHNTGIAADRMNIVLNGNAFVAKVGDSASLVGWGTSNSSELVTYNDLNVFARTKNPAWSNAVLPHGLQRDERLERAAAARIAVPMPADVAGAVGVPAGTAQVGPLP